VGNLKQIVIPVLTLAKVILMLTGSIKLFNSKPLLRNEGIEVLTMSSSQSFLTNFYEPILLQVFFVFKT